MSYPRGTSAALESVGYNPDTEYWVTFDGTITDITVWLPESQQPMPAEVQAILDSPEYADWLARNGGDHEMTSRELFKTVLNSTAYPDVVTKMVMLATLDGINQLRTGAGQPEYTLNQWLAFIESHYQEAFDLSIGNP